MFYLFNTEFPNRFSSKTDLKQKLYFVCITSEAPTNCVYIYPLVPLESTKGNVYCCWESTCWKFCWLFGKLEAINERTTWSLRSERKGSRTWEGLWVLFDYRIHQTRFLRRYLSKFDTQEELNYGTTQKCVTWERFIQNKNIFNVICDR